MRRSSSRRTPSVGVLALVALLTGCGRSGSGDETVTIAAAASLRRVLPPLIAAYAEARGPGLPIVATYGASGSLRRQVEAGAPVDLVILAGPKDVDRLVDKGLALADTRRVVARNTIVLIGPAGSAPRTFETLPSLPEGERIAVGDPASVPAGRYARQALEALGIWQALQSRLVLGLDVSAVLAYVRRGEVGAGIVYRTETIGVDGIVVLDEARSPWAPTPQVVAAVIDGSRHADEARAFLDFLGQPEARDLLSGQGFGLP